MRLEARAAVIGIVALNLSVTEFIDLQQLTPQERKTRLHLPAACVPQMTAMKLGSREKDRVMVEVRCAESDYQAAAPPARVLPRLQGEGGGPVRSVKR